VTWTNHAVEGPDESVPPTSNCNVCRVTTPLHERGRRPEGGRRARLKTEGPVRVLKEVRERQL
jgi:hypothetical protein